ncbi:hypothetical protein CVT25_004258 [Psilocybe cyanescens]|uniref:Uncharacterized protein n=1 Tax=Psilocybe cyanescens TaxID=93625 RepID=A0A409WXJ9_PSICY|nr:hypothetical protein CVT25_004258 [Psilocybe cyanescens]
MAIGGGGFDSKMRCQRIATVDPTSYSTPPVDRPRESKELTKYPELSCLVPPSFNLFSRSRNRKQLTQHSIQRCCAFSTDC